MFCIGIWRLESEQDEFAYAVPNIDDGLDINGWFSKPLILPTEEIANKNVFWIVLKTLFFKWNYLYNNHTIAVKFLTFVIYFVVGIMFYTRVEGWTTIECLYFISESITTIGLGDFHPTSNESRLFTIVYVIVGCTMMLNYFITFSRVYVTDCQDEIIDQIRKLCGMKDKPISPAVLSMYRVGLSVSFVLVGLLSGILYYCSSEDWTFMESLYFCVIVMSTVGFGDLVPRSDSGRLFSVFYMFSIVLVYVIAVNLRYESSVFLDS